MNQRPSKKEELFLQSSYDAFLDIFEEISKDSFWSKDPYYRLSRMRDAILIYSEILEYEPVGWFLDNLKIIRPPLEAELSKEYILFVRNILVHFPFYKSWDEIAFTKEMINWSKPGKSIDNFLSRFAGEKEIKYRMWKEKSKTMLYLSINFPAEYKDDTVIRLNQFMPEKEGFLFIISLMYRVLMSQVEKIK
ncbi:MAG: hypothetical protein IPJ68_02315 [Candidatus Moraniibacteriota bacterium]|nr:MAG: hypothetical protein IPJ68_02315 [Candidatus Moranbacteria bacterium]